MKTSPTTQPSEEHSITVVDDIVYGYQDYDVKLQPSSLAAVRGRYILYYGDYSSLAVANTLSSGELCFEFFTAASEDGIYAGFGDGKIHTAHEYAEASSVAMSNGDFIFNKADNTLYTYDAANHKFIKAVGKHNYVVDYIVDYVGPTLPSNLNYDEVVFLQLDDKISHSPIFSNCGRDVEITRDVCFANIQSILSDDAGIYVTVSYSSNYNSADAVRITHDLYAGDTVYNKADGYLYVYDGTNFIKAGYNPQKDSSVIAPVLDIVPVVSSLPSKPSAVGDKYIVDVWSDDHIYEIYTAVNADNWDNSGRVIADGERYASSTDHKIYEFNNYSDVPLTIYDIPAGATFFNKADNSLYVYDGTNFIKIGGN